MLPAGMGLVAVREALVLGAVRSLIAVPPSLTMQLPFSDVGRGVVVGVGVDSVISCVGVGLAGGSVGSRVCGGLVGVGVLVGATVAVGVTVGSGVSVCVGRTE